MTPHPRGQTRARSCRRAIATLLASRGWAILALALLLSSNRLMAFSQTDAATLASQNLRPYWHVFVAFALAWVLVFGWIVSVARRLARVERNLEE